MQKQKPRKLMDNLKKELTFNQLSDQNEFLKLLKNKLKREIKSAFRDPDILDFLLENQSNHLTKFNKRTYALFEKKTDDILKSFKKIEYTMEIMEETFRNVLLAIRQNEYLQAYYPAQQGYEEMKITGSHPIQIERRNNSNANKHTR